MFWQILAFHWCAFCQNAKGRSSSFNCTIATLGFGLRSKVYQIFGRIYLDEKKSYSEIYSRIQKVCWGNFSNSFSSKPQKMGLKPVFIVLFNQTQGCSLDLILRKFLNKTTLTELKHQKYGVKPREMQKYCNHFQQYLELQRNKQDILEELVILKVSITFECMHHKTVLIFVRDDIESL